MEKVWIKAIGIAALMILTLVTIAWTFASSPPIPKNFPLSQKWETKIVGDIEQISIVDNRIVIARTITRIYALDATTGNMLWERTTAWHLSYQPVIASETMLFLTDGKGIVALNKSDGSLVWQQSLRYPSGAEVTDIFQNLIAVNDTPFLSVYRADDGTLVWDKWVCREPVQTYFFNSHIVVPCFGFIVMDAFSGETILEVRSEPGLDRIWESAFADGVVYYSQDLEHISAYDLKNSKQLWNTPLKNDRSQKFEVFGKNLIVTTDDQICIINRDTGNITWCVNNLIKASNPTIFADQLYLFNGLRHGITAYDVREGEQRGRLELPAYNFITVDNRNLMASSDKFLIFGLRNYIFAYGK